MNNYIKLLKEIRDYIIREIIRSEFLLCNIADSISLLFFALLRRMSISTSFNEILHEALRICRRNYIRKKYSIKLIFPPRYSPIDIFWRDYSQVPRFLKKNSVVIDVGASIGDFSIILAKAFEAKKVISIEPDKRFYLYLLKNINLNNLKQNILPLNVAIGEKTGTMTLFKTSGFFLSKLIKGIPETFQCISLDDLINELALPRIDLIKIDTEGSELPILKGGDNILKQFKPRIILEIHSKKDSINVVKLLSKYNYGLVYEKVNFSQGLENTMEDYISVLYFEPINV